LFFSIKLLLNMKTRQLLSKALYSVLVGAAILFATPNVQAQVKIGSNPTTIDPNNNLEVEGVDPSKKFSVGKSGQVSIADGTQGAGKVFTSDANGGGSWKGTQLIRAQVDYVNNGVATVLGGSGPAPGSAPGNVSITFPENGTYAVNFSFIADAATPLANEASWIGINLVTGGVPLISHYDNLVPGAEQVFVSAMRYVTITNAPVTLTVNYLNTNSVSFTIRGHTSVYNDWFAYKVF
jgi:hypothetical protein